MIGLPRGRTSTVLVPLLLLTACAGPPTPMPAPPSAQEGPPTPVAGEPVDAGSLADTRSEVAPDVPAASPHDFETHFGPPAQSPPLQPPYPPPPIAVPAPNARGCVEQVATYRAALESHQQQARDREVSSVGARWTTRNGFFADPSANRRMGDEYTVGNRRFAVVGHSSDRTGPATMMLAQKGNTLHVVTDQARAIPVTVHACGMNPCPRGSGVRVSTRPVAIELQTGESMGPELVLHYDFWWPQLVYEKQRRCPPPPPAARAR